jgi:hypothetical protein
MQVTGVERREGLDLPDGQIAYWAVTRVGTPPSEEDSAEWADFDAAVFSPLQTRDPELARVMLDEFERTFLSASGLDESLGPMARREVHVEVGTTPKDALVLRFSLPCGIGQSSCDWDGTRRHAIEIATNLGQWAGDDLAADRDMWPSEWTRGATD